MRFLIFLRKVFAHAEFLFSFVQNCKYSPVQVRSTCSSQAVCCSWRHVKWENSVNPFPVKCAETGDTTVWFVNRVFIKFYCCFQYIYYILVPNYFRILPAPPPQSLAIHNTNSLIVLLLLPLPLLLLCCSDSSNSIYIYIYYPPAQEVIRPAVRPGMTPCLNSGYYTATFTPTTTATVVYVIPRYM